MMAPTHTLWALSGALGGCVITQPGLAQGAVFTGVTLASAMTPDRIELVGRHRVLKHRGVTHRWWAWLLISAIVGTIAVLVAPLNPFAVALAAGVLVGYGMHLYADLWTKSGAIGRRLPSGLQVRTGGVSEFFLAFLPAMVVCALLFYALLPGEAQTAVRDLVALRGG